MNKWIVLENYGTYNYEQFSFLLNLNAVYMKYDILELNFIIGCRLFWFIQNRRRYADVQMDLVYVDVTYNIPLEKIFSIPYFKKLINGETDDIKNAEKIQSEIKNNETIKKALFMRFARNLCEQVYGDEQLYITKFKERFGSYNDVVNYKDSKIFGSDDDFSEITNLEKCIISIY